MQVGDEVDVVVKSFDPEAKRISLSVKGTVRDPWLDKADHYREGSCVTGKITKLTDFGAFMELEPQLEGLIHLGEMSDKRIAKAEEVVHVGDQVKVKILQLDRKAKRIALSLTKAQEDAETAEYKDYMAGQEVKPATLGDELGDILQKLQ